MGGKIAAGAFVFGAVTQSWGTAVLGGLIGFGVIHRHGIAGLMRSGAAVMDVGGSPAKDKSRGHSFADGFQGGEVQVSSRMRKAVESIEKIRTELTAVARKKAFRETRYSELQTAHKSNEAELVDVRKELALDPCSPELKEKEKTLLSSLKEQEKLAVELQVSIESDDERMTTLQHELNKAVERRATLIEKENNDRINANAAHAAAI
jgi:hypothetical protein